MPHLISGTTRSFAPMTQSPHPFTPVTPPSSGEFNIATESNDNKSNDSKSRDSREKTVMGKQSVVSASVIAAYRATIYRVDGPLQGAAGVGDPSFDLRIGEPSDRLLRLHQLCRVGCSAFVTAFNPLGESRAAADNRARHHALERDLVARSLRYVAGEGIGAEVLAGKGDPGWPPEASFLVLGLSRQAAIRMGEQWQQNAIVWCGADAVPELLLLR